MCGSDLQRGHSGDGCLSSSILFKYESRVVGEVPTTSACTWWNRPEEDISSGKSESTHPSRTVVKSIEVFYGVESVVRGNADSLLN